MRRLKVVRGKVSENTSIIVSCEIGEDENTEELYRWQNG